MNETRKRNLIKFLDRYHISQAKVDLINRALTHPSYVFENSRSMLCHNQRLEFLGDAVLGVVIAEYLYENYPERPEGELTKMRAAVVNETTLARRARQLKLGDYILLGRGEELSGGRNRASILADAFEALIGALYLANGLETVRKFILDQLIPEIEVAALGNYGDYKTMLQELLQKKSDDPIFYVILEETGPDHDKRFVAGVSFKDQILASGKGRTKKEAEQAAAREALDKIKGSFTEPDGEPHA